MTDTSSEAETSFSKLWKHLIPQTQIQQIDLLNTTVSLSPDHADAYDYLGQAYFKKEEYQVSVDFFNKALEIQPNHTQAKTKLGVAQWIVYQDVF